MSGKNKVKTLALCIIALVFFIAVALGCWFLFSESKLDKIQQSAISELDANVGRYDESKIVLGNTSRSAATAMAEKYGAKLRITQDGSFATLTLPEGVTIRDVFSARENRGDIPYMSIDYMANASETDEDGLMPATPEYDVSDDLYGYQSYLDYINIGETWNSYRGSGVTVAVIDTGIDTDHPEFAGKISEYSYNATEDKVVKDYDLSVIEDEYGHGTAVAGTIAAAMDGSGTVGVAPEVSLLVIKAECSPNGTFYRTSDLVFGLYYAIERDADVVNMSFGGYGGNAYASATKLAVESDIVCVAAAGNDATSVLMYPAADENVIGVGALADGSYELAGYSNYGDNSDVVAPGTVYTTLMGGTYGTINGTSFASPIVAGAIALLKNQSAYMETEEVRELLYASTADIGSLGDDWFFGYGALDVNALVCEERGIVTFDMLTDEVEDIQRVFIRDHTLQNLPEPERNYAVFDGWYYDIHCTEELNWYSDRFVSDITLYANWVNEDDGIPYTYVILDDGTVEIRSYTGHRRYITIPDRIEGRVVSSIGDFAFENCSALRQINLPEGLVNIGMGAFSGCSQLSSVAIPDGVTYIGSQAFANNARLAEVAWSPDIALTTIGDMAFANCGSLTRFDVPRNVSYLNGSAFFGANGMRMFSVAAGNGHFYADGGVLFDITGDTLVAYPAGLSGGYDLPENVTRIGTHAFGYARLTDIDLGNVQTIDRYAFAYSLLEELSIPDSVTYFGEYAFAYNYYLKDLTIGRGVYSITKYAFMYDYELAELNLPANIIQIEMWAFAYAGVGRINFAPDGDLMQIGDYSFYMCDIRELDIPGSLMSIGGAAFSWNTALSQVTFTDNANLQYIGGEAFGYAYSLKSITLPDGLLEVGDYAFRDSALAGTVCIPASVNHIGFGVFAECHDLENIEVDADSACYVDADGVVYTYDLTTLVMYPVGNMRTLYEIPEGTLVVNEGAFYGAHELTDIVLPFSLTNIEAYAFYDVPNITRIDIPDNVIQISNYAFANDRALENINFTENSKLPRISYAAFAYTGITSFRVPASVTSVAQYAFEGCSRLTSITFVAGSKLESVTAYMFLGCDALTEVIFEDGSALSSIQAHGFEGMKKLNRVDFGDAALKNIDNFAFRYDEALQSITIPDGVEYIGRYAFYMAKSLSEVTLPASVNFIGRNAFYGTDDIDVYFTSELLPATLQENWDSGIAGYYLNVENVAEEGDWKYAVSASGNVTILEYNGESTEIDLNDVPITAEGDIVSIGGYAFYDSPVESVILPDTLINIQRYAFAYSALGSISVPAGVTFIGAYAFYNTPIESATFAEGSALGRIEQYAFAYTQSLSGIALPAALNAIGTYAFHNSGIAALTFAEDSILTDIPAHCFSATSLVGVVLPDSVVYVDDSAFRDCRNLASVTFGGGEDLQLHSNVFYNTGLTSLNIPANVEYIGEYTFVGLEKLTAFTVDENNKYYSSVDGVLYNKDGSKLIAMPAGRTGSFTVPAHVESIGFGAFENSSLSEVLFEDGINLLALGYRSFYNAENLKTISIPASVVSIDYYAFAECDSLYEVEFAPDNKLTGIYEGAFLNCADLTNIVVPDSIVEISDYAFYGCRSLDSLPVSDTSELKGIYDYAFAYSGIDELDLPVTITDIGDYAFMGTDLTSVTVPDDNKLYLNMGIGVFADCDRMTEITLPFVGAGYEDEDISWFGYIFGAGSYEANASYVPKSLEEVTISDGLTFIGENAFYGLADLKRINVPHSVTALYLGAFEGTTAIYELTNVISIYGSDTPSHSFFGNGISGTLHLAEGITKIGNWTMNDMGNLEEFIIPDSVTLIEYCAFYNCDNLLSVTIGSGVQEIGGGAFYGCTRLASVYNRSSLSIEFGAESNGNVASYAKLLISADGTKTYSDGEFIYIDTPDDFRFIKEGDNYTLIDYNGDNDIVELPVSIEGNMYEIYLERNTRIKKVIVPEGITQIGKNAFNTCTNLVEVILPESLLAIGESAFYDCTALKKVNIPSQVTQIPYQCFKNCSSLEEIIIPNGVTYIGDSAFEGTALKSVSIPDGVTYVRGGAFNNCAELTSVYIGSGLNEFSSSTFAECNDLNELIFSPENMNFVSINSFVYNKEVTEILFAPRNASGTIILPDTITHIGASAFSGCANITEIVIPESVTGIDSSAFKDCRSLTEINLPEGITSISGGVFENCSSLLHINIPSTVTTIESYAFGGCTKLSDVVIPDGVEFIGNRAFFECKAIDRIVLPDSVVTLDDDAFNSCYGLKEVVLSENMTEIAVGVFSHCYNLYRITIPAGIQSIDGTWAFYNCYKLYEVINNSALPITFDNADYGWLTQKCKVIINADGTKMTRYDDVITIDTPEGFRFVRENGYYSLNDYLGENTDIALPADIEGSSYSINLRGVSNIRSVVVPEGFTFIDDFAFYGCVNLESVALPSSIEVIGGSAFSECVSLKNVDMQSGVRQIGSDAFSNSTSLEEAPLPDTVTQIGSRVFQNTAFYNDAQNWTDGGLYNGKNLISVRKDITNFVVAGDTVCIAEDAFEDCFILTHVTIGGEHRGALYNVTNLRTLVLTSVPSSVFGYFDQYGASVPVTLENIVVRLGCEMGGSGTFSGIYGVTIYVEEKENNVLWDIDYPNWNNNNSVYYGGDWIKARFYDFENGLISEDYYTTEQMIRQPYVGDIIRGEEKYVFVGWDIDGDGVADTLPAMSAYDITAKAVMVDSAVTYSIVFLGMDNEVLYSYEAEYGSRITPPESVEIKGYDFIEWIGYVPGMTVTGDVEFLSEWQHVGGGHEYTCTTVDPTCTEEGYDLYVCAACGDEYRQNIVEPLGHTFGQWVTETPASCSEEGLAYRLCSACGCREESILAPAGHSYVVTGGSKATCTHSGERIYTCSVCGNVVKEEVDPTGHNYEKKVVKKSIFQLILEALANVFFGYEGEDIYFFRCADCGKIMTGENMPVMGTSSSGSHTHAGGEWTVLTPASCQEGYEVKYCLICNEVAEARVVAPNGSHVFGEWIQEVAPDCLTVGSERRDCLYCDASETRELAALGHDLVHHEAKSPTCTEVGWDAYDTCSRCDYTTYKEIPAKGHTPEAIPAKAATCTETGLTEGSKCSVCGVILEEQEPIPALGHAWSEWTQTKAPTCTEVGEDQRICANDPAHVETRTVGALGHDLVHHEAKSPTCTEVGWEAYDTCSRCDYTTYKEIPAKGHTPEVIPDKAATCTETGITEGSKCSVCGDILVEQETIPALGHAWSEWTQTKAPTCTEEGEEQRICANDPAHVETRTVGALGHDLVHHEAKAPTCTEIGWEAYDTCSRCDYTTYKEMPAKGHTPETIPGKAATCTETGLTEGSKCSVCGDILVEQETIPALNHDYTNVEPVWSWDGLTSATASFACTREGCEHVEVITAVITNEVTTAATCETEGVRTYTATVTFGEKAFTDTKTEAIAALGHDFGEWATTREPTATEDGEQQRECSRCGEKQTQPVPATGVGAEEEGAGCGSACSSAGPVSGLIGVCSALAVVMLVSAKRRKNK